MEPLFPVADPFAENTINPELQASCVAALEQGQIVYMPHVALPLYEDEKFLLSPTIKTGKAKNVSYCSKEKAVRHVALEGVELATLNNFMQRYVDYATQLVTRLFPDYVPHLKIGRTSYRPVEIYERVAPSYKKDDTRVHVDAFPTTPMQGQRILRVFCNIHPEGVPRVWQVGEPFAQAAARFLPQIKNPSTLKAKVLKTFKLTKSYRTTYDHYMLNLHDSMKHDRTYQNSVTKKQIDFPSNSTWIVYTDQVSHAALSGQYLLEQTFYLPPAAMVDATKTPLHTLEKMIGRPLI